MQNNKKISYIVLGIVAVAIVFYIGTIVGKNQSPNIQTSYSMNGRETFTGRNGTFASRGSGGTDAGTIIAKDTQSITIKLRDGGSKIILYTDKTPVMKTTNGSASDLTVGEEVNVFGATNTDGSVSANSIQIRPSLPQGTQTPSTMPFQNK